MTEMTYQPVTEAIIDRLAGIVGADNLSTAEDERSLRSHFESGQDFFISIMPGSLSGRLHCQLSHFTP
jgi:hypothetical protein